MSSILALECIRANSDEKIVHSSEYSNNKIKEKRAGGSFSLSQSRRADQGHALTATSQQRMMYVIVIHT